MTTRHMVDPEIAPMLDTFPALVFSPETLPSKPRVHFSNCTTQERHHDLERLAYDPRPRPIV